MRRSIARFLIGLAMCAAAVVAQEAPEPEPTPRQLTIANKVWTGDFDRLLERRMIRVLVPYSRTIYYNDKGRERGWTADLVRELEQYINEKHRTGNRPVTVYLIPTTRDKLLQFVADGMGDIAAGNLTITPARERVVDFALQGRTVREVVVTGAGAAPLASLADLGGRTVHVRPSSSYHESLQALNQRNREAGVYAKQRASYAYRLSQAMKRVRQMQDPTRAADWQRFHRCWSCSAATATATRSIRSCSPRRAIRSHGSTRRPAATSAPSV